MRLHYYAPAVSNSYCVGIHNGHGIGSVFAKLFSKVAAKTAAQAAARVAKTAGKKVLSAVAKKGSELGKQAIEQGISKSKSLVKELGKKAVLKAGAKVGELINEGVTRTGTLAKNAGFSPELVSKAEAQAKDTVDSQIKLAQNSIGKAGVNFLSQAGDRLEATSKSLLEKAPLSAVNQPKPTKPKRKLKSKLRLGVKRKRPLPSIQPREKELEGVIRSIDEDE